MSSPDHETITDTVVLLYFLLADEADLLTTLQGGKIQVPRSVYDPDDRNLPSSALAHTDLLSEIRKSVRYYETNGQLPGADSSIADRVRVADALYDSGVLRVVDMASDELAAAAELQSRRAITLYPINVPLGAGEAACIAIANSRAWWIATDDADALKVMRSIQGPQGFGYERIRKLLIRAATGGLISRAEANAIHLRMRSFGFWDRGTPFPNA